jgi:hypothetical protein
LQDLVRFLRVSHREARRTLGIPAGGGGRRFFMPDLIIFELILMRMQAFKDAVNPVARQTEYGFDSSIDEALDQQVGHGFSHRITPL